MGQIHFRLFFAFFATALGSLSAGTSGAHAQDPDPPRKDEESATTGSAEAGPDAALAFERSFRRENNAWKPVPLDQCRNIQPLTEELWSKKQVLTDFKRFRSKGQVGAIVIVKTEFCCEDSRLCAVTTACMEKKSTLLVERFRVYAGWIKNHSDDEADSRISWDQKLIDEYGFIQGPGARIVVMVPTGDGTMYQWFSDASELELSLSEFESSQGRTPKLERFLAEALKYAPRETSCAATTDN
jgi:hypothetical protein